MSPSFLLDREPWLCAMPVGGAAPATYGLRRVLLEAHELGDLVVPLATVRPALLRQLLLPVVVDALGRPADEREWARWFSRKRWTDEQRDRLGSYLDEHTFDLFDAAQPFAQVAGLRTAKDETKGVGLLVATEATGNNVPLFGARTEADPPVLTPSQAAHWLLHAHCWDTAAIKTGAVGDPRVKAGKTTGNPTGPLGQMGVTVPVGSTLYETLLLNIPVGPPLRSDDLPSWRRPSSATPTWQSERAPAGLLELWTWQSRRIRLLPEDRAEGVRVTRVVLAAGDRLPHVPEFDPHTMWRTAATGKPKRGGKTKPLPPRRPLRLQPGKAAWRGLDALLAVDRQEVEATESREGFATSLLLDQAGAVRADLGEQYPLRVELIGVEYGNQSAVIEDVMFDALPLPLAALSSDTPVHDAVLEIAGQADQLGNALNRLSADLRRAVGAEPIPWNKGQRPSEALLHDLDPLVRRLLVGLRTADEEKVEAGQLAWEKEAMRRVWRIADRLLRAVPATAYAGRTVEDNTGKERTYRASLAEASFRDTCKSILYRAAEAGYGDSATDGMEGSDD
ncbi:type I-E CRISPR-associated protein Cse1/CasA [Streptomyces durbertensis]|uniref:Type I-E CRISPR-associated protein Cse1/CasA n=1 Tax=Streptomyces durbertensis TaxID=2448886 RepID=A0ABR6EG58_9ACTN|nr:type I-E CRISPR-associated protein Cse1/CasA [Streptomyces durbertensis]MBB1244325.1 type I-E CRISPR-associated protein Cse1/CasA [Streptomyces durbertensis]